MARGDGSISTGRVILYAALAGVLIVVAVMFGAQVVYLADSGPAKSIVPAGDRPSPSPMRAPSPGRPVADP